MPHYYKSLYLADPVVYVQEDGSWRSYARGGIVTESIGAIPVSVLAQCEKIGPSEAEDLIARRVTEAREAALQRDDAARYEQYVSAGRSGVAAWLMKRGTTWGMVDIQVVCSATASGDSQEVREVTTEWARDLGWRPVAMGDAFLLFALRGHPLWGGPEAEVSAYTSDDTTRVQFLIRASSAYPGLEAELARAAEAFANGVCYELARRGRRVSPGYLAEPRQNRGRLTAIERIRRPAHWAILAALVPLPVVVGLLTLNSYLAVAALGWLMTLFFTEHVIRLRTVGMRATLQIALIVCTAPAALGCTIAGILEPL